MGFVARFIHVYLLFILSGCFSSVEDLTPTIPENNKEVENLVVTPVSSTTIELEWEAPDDNAKSYRISYVPGDVPPKDCNSGTIVNENQSSAISETKLEVSGLTPGTEYSFTVCSNNRRNIISNGTSVTASTLAPPPPNVIGLSATPISSTEIQLDWTSGGGSTTNYVISYQAGASAPADCDSGTLISAENITGTSHNFAGLLASTQYSFKVCAKNDSPSPEFSSGTDISASTHSTTHQKFKI